MAIGLVCLCSFAVYYFRLVHGLVSNASGHVPQPKAVLYFIYGSIAKLVLQIPTIALFHSYGPLISTTIGLIIPNVLMYRDICKVTGVKRKVILKRTILISLLTLVMFISVGAIQWILGFVFQPSGRLRSFLYVALVGAMGGRSLRILESPYPFVG